MLIRDAEVGGAIFHMPAFYTQFSRRFHSYRPYVRYELAEYAGVKLQYDRYARRGEPGWNQVATQFAFTF